MGSSQSQRSSLKTKMTKMMKSLKTTLRNLVAEVEMETTHHN